jgi:hypothetical protein
MPGNRRKKTDGIGETTRSSIQWPEGKRFAFTIFDDTDNATLANVAPVYELLERLNFRTTKSVWPLQGEHAAKIGGATCANPVYREWIQQLKRKGFDIGLHGATLHSSNRENSLAGIEKFRDYFGDSPLVFANHAANAEDIYWGPYRFTGINRWIYHVLTKGVRYKKYDGHLERSPRFWGDLCRQHVKYVRDFVFTEINTLKECPFMPYHDPERPYVNYWFASSEGADVNRFIDMISVKNQDKLEQEGGACIMYTHFASGFYKDGRLNPVFCQLMERLSKKNGWFVPVAVLLDFLLTQNGSRNILPKERRRIERKFLVNRVKLKLTAKNYHYGTDNSFI